jgi:dehydrogenase
MKAIVIYQAGDAQQLQVEERPIPTLKEGWTLEDFDPTRDLLHNAYLTTFYSGSVNAEKIKSLFTYIEQYHVLVTPERVFRLEEIVSAHQYVESSEGYGKVVVVN